MPKLITLSSGAKWREAGVSGDFKDSELGFLGSFQELLPEDLEHPKETNRKKISNLPKKIQEVLGVPNGNDHGKSVESTNVKSKRVGAQNNKKDMHAEAPDAVSMEQKVLIGKKKKKSKRKKLKPIAHDELPAVKKAKLATDGSPQVSVITKGEGSMTKKEELEMEHVERILIDDEELSEEEDEPCKSKQTQKSAWDELFLPDVLTNAIKGLRFDQPTEIQRQVLPLAIRDRCDVLGAAETGSGKTLAYALPMAVRLLEVSNELRSSRKGPMALILAPTRELIVQVMKHVTAVLRYTQFKASSIIGGFAEVKQARILKQQKPEVIAATPGRLWAMMNEKEEGAPIYPYLLDWSSLVCLVVDETDRMVEKGHFEELQDILKLVRKSATDKLQTLVFSATLTYVHHEQSRQGLAKKELTPAQKIKELIQLTGIRPQCKVVDITRPFGTAESLVETRINCSTLLEKDTTVVYLLERYKGRTLIFMNSVDATRRLYGILKLLKLQPLMIHARMDQKVRLKNLEKFAADSRSVLLATDVAARGLDIQGIDNVIHYQVPRTAEMYIHRSGRTARASRKGLSVLIVDSKDAHLYQRLCKNLNREKDLPVFPIDCQELMKRLITRVKLAAALDTLAHKSMEVVLYFEFRKLFRRAMGVNQTSMEAEQSNSNSEINAIKVKEAKLQTELRAELAEPLPSLDKLNFPKTRYINPDVLAQYRKVKSTSVNCLESLEEKLAEAEMKKKKARKLITTNQLKMKAFRRKKRV